MGNRDGITRNIKTYRNYPKCEKCKEKDDISRMKNKYCSGTPTGERSEGMDRLLIPLCFAISLLHALLTIDMICRQCGSISILMGAVLASSFLWGGIYQLLKLLSK